MGSRLSLAIGLNPIHRRNTYATFRSGANTLLRLPRSRLCPSLRLRSTLRFQRPTRLPIKNIWFSRILPRTSGFCSRNGFIPYCVRQLWKQREGVDHPQARSRCNGGRSRQWTWYPITSASPSLRNLRPVGLLPTGWFCGRFPMRRCASRHA